MNSMHLEVCVFGVIIKYKMKACPSYKCLTFNTNVRKIVVLWGGCHVVWQKCTVILEETSIFTVSLRENIKSH